MKIVNQKNIIRVGFALLFLAIGWLLHFQRTVTPPAPAQVAANNDYQEDAVLWMQSSGEEKALAYQAYALGRILLDADIKTPHPGAKKPAIVVDIDETILDNSPYQAGLIRYHRNFTGPTWADWVKREEATAVPGAVDFLNYAANHGVKVFYITNRSIEGKEATMSNLRKLGFPGIDIQSVKVQTDPGDTSKEVRRNSVASDYRIVMLMGDNLNDFSGVFEQQKTVARRIGAVEENKNRFGAQFVVLPNPMYGDWENAIYNYDFTQKPEQKEAERLNLLKTY